MWFTIYHKWRSRSSRRFSEQTYFRTQSIWVAFLKHSNDNPNLSRALGGVIWWNKQGDGPTLRSVPGRNRPHRERGGAGLCLRQETAQLTELVVRRPVYQSLVWAAAQTNRQQELAVIFHIHLVLDLDVIAVDKTGRRAEL